MKLTKTKRRHTVAFNMTPLIDIVFLLIIFFMTVSQITRIVDQPIPLPSVVSGASDGSPATVTINVIENGDIVVAGKKYSLDRTAQILKTKIDQSNGDANKVKIEIRCDKRCSTENVNRIIEELSNVGFKYVTIAVTGEN